MKTFARVLLEFKTRHIGEERNIYEKELV